MKTSIHWTLFAFATLISTMCLSEGPTDPMETPTPWKPAVDLVQSQPNPLPYYDLGELHKYVGKSVRIVGRCGNANVRSGVLTVRIVGKDDCPIRIIGPWPDAVRKEYRSGKSGLLVAEIEGTLDFHDDTLHFSRSDVIRYWREETLEKP